MVDTGTCLSWIFVIFLVFVPTAQENKGGLYSENGPVTVLTGSNFKDTVPNSDNTWMVEFYSSWCGHCVRFAPTYLKVAQFVKGWRQVIRVGAVDCAQDYNTALCKEYGIDMYPTIKFFDLHSKSGDLGRVFNGSQDDQTIRHAMVDHINRQRDLKSKWPWLLPIRSMQSVWKDLGDTEKDQKMVTAVLFEEEGSYVGQEVILSVLPYREKIIVRRMLKQDMRKIQVDSLPALVHLDKTGSYSELALGETKSLVFIRELYNLAGIDEEEEEGEVQKDDGSLLLIDAGLRVYMQDLESTLHYSFRKEICNFKVVKGEDLAALKSYVSVLSKYFPGQPHVVKYLWSLNKWMQSVSGQVTDKEWEAKVKELKTKDAYLPEVTKWVACQGSAEKYRGYPCGLWTLFHVLSVQAVDVNLDNEDFEAAEVLFAMDGYITRFFGCRECGKNFKYMSSKLEKGVGDINYGIMWMWEAHNKANKRLHGDLTEDPKHPKIQFPTYETCPSCHHSTPSSPFNKDMKIWDRKEVLKFLKLLYGKQNIIMDLGDTEKSRGQAMVDSREQKQELAKLQAIRRQKQQAMETEAKIRNDRIQRLREQELETRHLPGQRVPGSWNFTSVDLSLCVLVYFVATGIIVLLYFHISRRRKKAASLKSCCV